MDKHRFIRKNRNVQRKTRRTEIKGSQGKSSGAITVDRSKSLKITKKDRGKKGGPIRVLGGSHNEMPLTERVVGPIRILQR